jgi:hypothetical protein
LNHFVAYDLEYVVIDERLQKMVLRKVVRKVVRKVARMAVNRIFLPF